MEERSSRRMERKECLSGYKRNMENRGGVSESRRRSSVSPERRRRTSRRKGARSRSASSISSTGRKGCDDDLRRRPGFRSYHREDTVYQPRTRRSGDRRSLDRRGRRKRERTSDEGDDDELARMSHRDGWKRRRKRERRRSSTESPRYRRPNRQCPAEVSVDGECSESRPCSPTEERRDDSVGHFRGRPGSVIDGRYRILKEVGLGTFGRVIECRDLQGRSRDRSDRVAIKVIRRVKRYCESAVIEARIIQDVNKRGGRGLSHFAILYDDFSFDGHYSLVFECLGPSLYDFLKKHNYVPFPMTCIQDFSVQLLEALEFIHGFRLCHTDLKIENVLLVNGREASYRNQPVPASTRIKVIDFGGATYDSDRKSRIINTRQYRAPEVLLQTGWSMPADIWSLGCILAELYLGDLLFATHDDLEHLALMESIIGPFPDWMLQKSSSLDTSSNSLVRRAFNSSNRHRLELVLSQRSASYVRNSRALDSIVRNPEDKWFLNLLHRILVIDPNERATAHESLRFLSRIGRNVVHNA